MKFFNYKTILSSTIALSLLTGCANTSTNQTFNDNQNAIIGSSIGVLAGIVLGNNLGGGSKNRNKAIGAIAGAAIGGAIGYKIDQQAKEIADSLNTNVNNNPNAILDPNTDLIVSNSDSYVKIMFRDDMMFETNSSTPTYNAQTKIAKINSVLQKYPNTLIQVVGHTDSRGSYSYNLDLSQKRATNVGNIIYDFKIENQIFSRGCSYDKPIAPNDTPLNMALNRRVEVYLYPNQQSVIDVCK